MPKGYSADKLLVRARRYQKACYFYSRNHRLPTV
jgi:hypothetical protein